MKCLFVCVIEYDELWRWFERVFARFYFTASSSMLIPWEHLILYENLDHFLMENIQWFLENRYRLARRWGGTNQTYCNPMTHNLSELISRMVKIKIARIFKPFFFFDYFGNFSHFEYFRCFSYFGHFSPHFNYFRFQVICYFDHFC